MKTYWTYIWSQFAYNLLQNWVNYCIIRLSALLCNNLEIGSYHREQTRGQMMSSLVMTWIWLALNQRITRVLNVEHFTEYKLRSFVNDVYFSEGLVLSLLWFGWEWKPKIRTTQLQWMTCFVNEVVFPYLKRSVDSFGDSSLWVNRFHWLRYSLVEYISSFNTCDRIWHQFWHIFQKILF